MTATRPSQPEPAPADPRAVQIQAWRRIHTGSAAFLVVVALAMAGSHLRLKANDPWKSPVLKEEKERLRLAPKDEAVKQRIRDLDLQLRRRYFSILGFNATGISLLIAGLAVFVTASSRIKKLRRVLPRPVLNPDAPALALREQNWSRWAVVGTATTVTVIFAGLTLATGTGLPGRPAELQKLVRDLGGGGDTPDAVDAASREELQANWPRFLGFDGNPMAGTNAPTQWDAASGAGVAWKVPVPLPGFNSPVVWAGRVFLSGGDKAQREVLCFDARDGRIAWRQPVDKVPGSPAKGPEISDMTGYAPSSVATDGRRVYAIFPNGDLAAFTIEGRPVWSKNLGVPENMYGHTASLATWQDRVIIQFDQAEPENNKSKLIALNGRTGQVLWQRPRPVGSTWSTPTVFEFNGRAQIVALAVPWTISYSAQDGSELWRVEGMKGEITPSPAFANGLLLATSPTEHLFAIRPDGNGDVTKSHIAWTATDNIPDVTSPVSSGELVFTITTGGLLTCFDMKDGKKVWDKDLDTEFHATPTIAGGKIYLFGQTGLTLVLDAGRAYQEVLRTQLPDSFHASPAIVGGAIYVRGLTNLWKLGAVQAETTAPKRAALGSPQEPVEQLSGWGERPRELDRWTLNVRRWALDVSERSTSNVQLPTSKVPKARLVRSLAPPQEPVEQLSRWGERPRELDRWTLNVS